MKTAEALNVPLSRVFSASTFYNAFSLNPKGERIIRVCVGTACHIRGAALITGSASGFTAGEVFVSTRPLGTTNLMKFLFA